MVAWNHTAGSALTVAPHIQQVKNLGGKEVAVPFWYSIHNVVLQHLLRENGLAVVTKPNGALKANEVALSVMAPADMGPALANGAIAASGAQALPAPLHAEPTAFERVAARTSGSMPELPDICVHS